MTQGKAVPLHIIKMPAPDGADRSNLQYSCFTPGKHTPVCIKKRLGGPQARLDVLEKRKSLSTATNQSTSHPVSSAVTVPIVFAWQGEQYIVLSPPYS